LRHSDSSHRDTRLERHSLSNMVFLGRTPEGDDHARGLMAQHHRRFHNEVTDAAVLVIVDV